MLPDLAYDKRTVDQDGRLHVPGCRISKANVCPYLGREIPNHQALGLDAGRVYMLYRTPELLQFAASSFDNIPLTVDHVPVSADDFPEDRIGGTVSRPRFEYPYLIADVTAWTREARDGIESKHRKELSCAYRYVADMIPGTSPDGVRYDGLMIPPGAANHVALVTEGRAGPDVMVADGVPRMSTSRFPKFIASIAAVLGTLAKPEQLAAMDNALTEELTGADDGFPDLSAEDKAAACDNARKMFGKDSLSPDEERAAYQQAAKDKAGKVGDHGKKQGASDGIAVPAIVAAPVALDSAEVRTAIDAAVATARDGYVTKADADKMAADAAAAADVAARAEVNALYAAREDVADKVGDVVTLDSAEAVYRFALDKLAIPHKDVPAAALAALYAGVKNAPLAADAAPARRPVRASDIFTTDHIRR